MKHFFKKYVHELRSRNDERVHNHVQEHSQLVIHVHDHGHEAMSLLNSKVNLAHVKA
jgi:hypothetical protein